jgi:hypothetical protein
MRDIDPAGRPSLGWLVVKWIEAHLRHGPGDVQGERIRLDAELFRFVVGCYALDERTGARIYDEAALFRPKGRAKSELAGMLAVAETFGAVRFDHWAAHDEPDTDWGYRFTPGDPVGRIVRYPFVRCLATEEGQTGHTYGNVAYMLDTGRAEHPEVFAGADIGRDWQSSTRTLIAGGGEIRPSTASSAAKDGGKETFSVADETHLYVYNELRDMFEVVQRNTVKRAGAQGWMLQTSTMFAPGEDSIAERTHTAAERGELGDEVLFDHKGAADEAVPDLDDDEALDAALDHVYGPFALAMDRDRIKRNLRDKRLDENTQRRYWLNQRRPGTAAWLDVLAWDALAAPSSTVPDGQVATLGFDGALTRDCAALLGCTPADPANPTGRRHWFVINIWERPPGPRGLGWAVDQEAVDAAVRGAHGRWRIVRHYNDPSLYQGWIAAWAQEFGDKVVLSVGQSFTRMHPIIGAATDAIIGGELLTQDGDARLRRHVGNAHRHYGSASRSLDPGQRQPFTIRKESPDSARKIDAAVAGCLADAAYRDALAAGQLTPEPVTGFYAAVRRR